MGSWNGHVPCVWLYVGSGVANPGFMLCSVSALPLNSTLRLALTSCLLELKGPGQNYSRISFFMCVFDIPWRFLMLSSLQWMWHVMTLGFLVTLFSMDINLSGWPGCRSPWLLSPLLTNEGNHCRWEQAMTRTVGWSGGKLKTSFRVNRNACG